MVHETHNRAKHGLASAVWLFFVRRFADITRTNGTQAVSVTVYSFAVGKRRVKELGQMPKAVRMGIVVLGLVFSGLILAAGKFYLPNWRGNTVFLPVALFIALLVIAAVLVQLFKTN